MKNSTILIAVSRETCSGDLAKKLEAIRAVPAHTTVIVVNEMPVVPYYSYGIPPYGTTEIPEDWRAEVAENKRAAAAKVAEIKLLLEEHGVSGGVSAISCEPNAIGHHIAQQAMVCDIVWVSEDLRKHAKVFDQLLHGVLFRSPVGALINDTKASMLNGPKTVFVAWNTQLQSARAVHLALPALRRAQEVIIGSIDPVKTEWRDGEDPGVDIAKWLSHHGRNVILRQFPSGGQGIATCILNLSKEAGADLIVSGAYGHSRTREAVFGGTTRDLIKQTDQAVFMAH